MAEILDSWLELMEEVRRSEDEGAPPGEGEEKPEPSQKPARYYGFVLAAIFLILGIVMLTITLAADLIVDKGELEDLEVVVVHAERLPAAVMGLVLLVAAWWILQAARQGTAKDVITRLAISCIPFFMVVFGGIMPALNPAKTYRPQCDWIRSEIGWEESFGLAYPPRGHHKMGGFSMYSGVHVELLNDRHELEGYLEAHPGSVVLLHSEHTDDYFAPDDENWRQRIVRELLVGRDRYLVLRARPAA